MGFCDSNERSSQDAKSVAVGFDIRKFDTGATRDTDNGKYDWEGFLSPLALERYASYMHKHRVQSDGTLRDSDNWQKGIPLNVYMKSLWRHFVDLWFLHRGHKRSDYKDGHVITKQEALCAILFNTFGYLHVLQSTQGSESEQQKIPCISSLTKVEVSS